MAKKKIEWLCFTDNKEWGRFLIGRASTKREALELGEHANKGKYVVEPRRIWK